MVTAMIIPLDIEIETARRSTNRFLYAEIPVSWPLRMATVKLAIEGDAKEKEVQLDLEKRVLVDPNATLINDGILGEATSKIIDAITKRLPGLLEITAH